MNPLLRAALRLASAGWSVFPCNWWPGEYSKAPLLKGEGGFHHATTDPQMIKEWWAKWPRALIGATVPADLIVLDIDPRNGGSRDALEQIAGGIPSTLTTWSGGPDAGCHLYFQRPLGPLTSTLLPAGIDLKVGGKGYCIVPPSRHPDTRRPYRWGPERYPAILPQKIAELLIPPKPIYRARAWGASAVGLLRKVAEASEGNRNNALFWAACRAAEDGILDQIAEELIAASVSTGLPETSARKTIASARRTI